MKTVLLIDNTPDIVKLGSKYLTSIGYNVLAANCVEAALQVMCSATPDCIVLEVQLTDDYGAAVLNKIHHVCSAPIILLSYKDNDDDQRQALISGGDDYIAPTFTLRGLGERIDAQLQGA